MINKCYIEKAQNDYLTNFIGFDLYKDRMWVNRFENKFLEFISPNQKKYAVAVNSGDSALHLAIRLCDLNAGDEVLVPSYSFVSTINTLLLNNLIPKFVDIDSNTLGISSELLEKNITSKTKAIMVVHLFGIPADIIQITAVAKKYNLKVIEDCAQAFGSKVNGRYLGCFGDVACFSFNRNKIVTCEEGGLVLCSNKNDEERLKILISNGIDVERQVYLEPGYSFRMTEWQACLLCTQLDDINEILMKNIKLCEKIHQCIDNSNFHDYYSENIIFYRYPISINKKLTSKEFSEYKMEFIMSGFKILTQKDYILPELLGLSDEFPCAEYLRSNTIKVSLEENYGNDTLSSLLNISDCK